MAKSRGKTASVDPVDTTVVEPHNADKLLAMLVPVDPGEVDALIQEWVNSVPQLSASEDAGMLAFQARVARDHEIINLSIIDCDHAIEACEENMRKIMADNQALEDEMSECQRRIGNRRYQWQKAIRATAKWKIHYRRAKFNKDSEAIINAADLVVESRVNAECGDDVLRVTEIEELLTAPHAAIKQKKDEINATYNLTLVLREDAKKSEVESGKLEAKANELLVANGWQPKDAVMLVREMINQA